MSIIFYEYEHCENIINKGVNKLVQKDLNLLAAYWEHEGEKLSQIKNNIESFCLKNDKYFNLVQSSKMIKRALSYARNNKLRFPTPIIITQNELNAIIKIDNYNNQKFLFAMLVCAKFFKKHQSRNKLTKNKYSEALYSNNSIKDIQEIAGTKFTNRYWNDIKHRFTTIGLISPTIIGSKRWAIGFVNDNSEPCLIIEDYRNIIAYFQEYSGEKMIECEGCGVKTIRKSGTHLYCKKCWNNKYRELNKEQMRRNRNKKLLC